MDAILKHFNAAVSGKTKPEREAGASAFAAGVAKTGVALSFHEMKINDLLTTNFTKEGKKGATQREGAARVVGELVKASPEAAPLLLPVTQLLFEVQGDKAKPVAEAATEASKSLWAGVDENLLKVALP